MSEALEMTAHRLPGAPGMEIVPAPRGRPWMERAQGAKRCLPIGVANEAGWWILNPSRFEVVWTGESHELGVNDPATGRPPVLPYLNTNFGHGILTVLVPFLFRTSPGWDLLARGPSNLPKHGIQALEGLVETDWSVAPFTMNWQFTAPNTPVVFEAGDPLCQIVPMERGGLGSFEPRVEGMGGELLGRYEEWSRTRQEARRPALQIADTEDWERQQRAARGNYARGRFSGDAEKFGGHQVRLRLRPFSEYGR